MKRAVLIMMAALGLTAFQADAQTRGESRSVSTPAAQETTVKGDELSAAPESFPRTAEQCKAYAEEKAVWLDANCGGLRADQRQSIHDIYESAYLDIKALKDENPEMSRKELKTKAKPMLEDAQDRALKVLDQRQMDTLNTRASKGKAAEGTNKGKAQAYVNRETEELDQIVGLSEEQKVQVKELHTNLWKEGKAWKEANPEATAEQKRAYQQEQKKTRLDGYRSILNDDQIAKYKATMGEK